MHNSISSLIECYQRTIYLLLFVIGFNTSNIYALLYDAPTCGDSSICPYLGYWSRAFEWLLVFVYFFLHTSTFSHTL